MFALCERLKISVFIVTPKPVRQLVKSMSWSLWNSLKQICSLHIIQSYQTGFRVLGFAQRVSEANAVQQFLTIQNLEPVASKNVFVYHWKLQLEVASDVHCTWNSSLKKREVCIMSCTSAFGTGIDSELVRVVLRFE